VAATGTEIALSESMETMTIDNHPSDNEASPGVRLKTPPFVHLSTYDRMHIKLDGVELSRTIQNPWTA
jgi:hypothetical protein